MRLWSDWDSVFGVIQLYRQNGEWRMENGEWGTGTAVLHSPFSILLSSKTHSQQRTLFDGALGVELVGF